MDKKDIKLLEKLFWEDKPGAYNFRTFVEIEEKVKEYKKEKNVISPERQKINFEDRYKYIASLRVLGREKAEEFNKYLDSLPLLGKIPDHILTIGIYNGYKTGKMKILKDALYTFNHIEYAENLTTISGNNTHARNFADVIYAFADCDLELVKKYFSESLGMVNKGTHHFDLGTNLIMSMVYSNKKWLEETLKSVEKFLPKKGNLKSSVLVIKYLIALSQNDMKEASDLLQNVANEYKKITWLFNFKNPFLKFFGVYVHGLYNLAHFVLPQEKFKQLKAPEHTVFWNEFDEYTKQNNFTKGNLCLNLTGEISEFKRLFD